jgi:hypothetical protein
LRKTYEIQLNGIRIGTTEFESADPAMGVVSGKITFENIKSGYAFFKDYCLKNKVIISTDYPEDKFIDTQVIPELKVLTENKTELKGFGAFITGFDAEEFEITVGGIDSEFYKIEFSKHYNEYFNPK